MRRHTIGSLCYYTFELLEGFENLTHGVSTRLGGVSERPFHSLNLSFAVGDAPENVRSNVEQWHSVFDIDPLTTVTAAQCARDSVALVAQEQRGSRIQNTDALVTAQRGTPLLLRFADCVPVLFYDPVHHAVGIVHAGWRGTVLNVTGKTIAAMVDTFGTQPAELIACIGPSIGPCCYEIHEDVAIKFREAFGFSDGILVARQECTFLNLWIANALQIEKAGVKHCEVAQLCTAHHTDEFFSARAEQYRTGRFGGIIELR